MGTASTLYQRIYDQVRAIPPGHVMSYGQVGALVGCPARVVGYALHVAQADVPWQRVVNRLGMISTSGADQQRLLEAEGVVFDHAGRIDLGRFGWFGPPVAEPD